MNTLADFEQAIAALNALQERLKEIDQKKTDGINFFYATGMQTQEIKHSAFLAWLLNPHNSHKLGTKFLHQFLQELISHNVLDTDKDLVPQLRQNKETLQTHCGVSLISDLDTLFQAEDISVLTERQIGMDGRIDIFLESPAAKTLIVIENKVFTGTHDNQLLRYETEFENRRDWKRIYVFLTPFGSYPEDMGEYRDKWCVFSYVTLLEIIAKFVKTASSRKLKYVLEDYIEMVNTEILKKKKELALLCRQIRREHSDALRILNEYTDNVEKVMEYAWEYLEKRIPDMTVLRSSNKRFDFYTPTMSAFFMKRGSSIEIDNTRVKFRCNAEIDGGITIGICLEKRAEDEWDIPQTELINRFEPNKISRKRFVSLKQFCFPLLTEEEREKDFGEIEPRLKETMDTYYCALRTLEDTIKD